MFERYTEGARRSIFFSRYEASQFGSGYIEIEHVLLGLLREDKGLFRRLLPGMTYELVREEVVARTKVNPSIPTNVDLPLTNDCSRALKFAAEEAERLAHRHIGTDHLLLGLLREEHFASQLLREHNADLAKLRLEVSKMPSLPGKGFPSAPPALRRTAETVEIHGARRSVDQVQILVKRCREDHWHWRKCSWTARDIVVALEGGAVSFDLELAKDRDKFQFVEKGWKKDYCLICRWELFESASDPEHGIGYSNGKDWLCSECYDKFLEHPDFFSSSYRDMT